MYVHTYIYIYIYTNRERERERERERDPRVVPRQGGKGEKGKGKGEKGWGKGEKGGKGKDSAPPRQPWPPSACNAQVPETHKSPSMVKLQLYIFAFRWSSFETTKTVKPHF